MASNIDDITAIRTRFLDAWADATPVIIPNVTDGEAEPDTAYVVLSVMPTVEDRLTIGPDPDYEARGLIWIDVYSPIADRDAAAWSLADRVGDIFRDWQSPDYRIRCDKVSFRNGEDAGEHMRLIVNVTYRSRH